MTSLPVLFTHADRASRYAYAFWDRNGRAMVRYCARHQLAHDPFARLPAQQP